MAAHDDGLRFHGTVYSLILFVCSPCAKEDSEMSCSIQRVELLLPGGHGEIPPGTESALQGEVSGG